MSNFIDFLRACIHNAKVFLRENPTEKIAAAAVMFKLSHSTLYNLLTCNKKPKSRARGKKHSGQNKILKEHQEKAVKQFIQSLLMYSIKSSYDVVYLYHVLLLVPRLVLSTHVTRVTHVI